LQHLQESSNLPQDKVQSVTQTLLSVQEDLTTKTQQLLTIKRKLVQSVHELTSERDAHRVTNTILRTIQQNLVTSQNNLTTSQNNTLLATNQLVTVRQELEVADVGNLSEIACPMFAGKKN